MWYGYVPSRDKDQFIGIGVWGILISRILREVEKVGSLTSYGWSK